MEVKTDSLRAWLLATRPKTLSGAAVPVMIGGAWSWTDAQLYDGQPFRWLPLVLCFLFAFIMQINANLINDFFDYVNGTDNRETRLGPPRACAQGWVKLDSMKRAIALCTCLAVLVGLPLIWFGGLEMVLIGLLCIVFCFLYTTHLSYLGMGDLLVLLFFGIVPVCITYYIQLHTCTWTVFVSSVACGLVIDALLIVNNYRDRDTDREAGKKTLVVMMGEENSRSFYLATGITACILSGCAWIAGHPLATLLPLIYLVLHVTTYLNIKRIDHGRELNRCLGQTARNIFVYGLTGAAGLLLL